MSDETVVRLFEGDRSLLHNIPAMLRRAADVIESGRYGDVQTAYLVLPVPECAPRVFGWGDIDGDKRPIVQFEMARHYVEHYPQWLIRDMPHGGVGR